MNELHITRLLLNPMGRSAPEGERGDIVRIADGLLTLYMDTTDFDACSEQTIRYRLASQGHAQRTR